MKLPGVRQNMPASARRNLAEIQAMAGDVPGALKTLRSIDDQNYQRFALEKVVSARARRAMWPVPCGWLLKSPRRRKSDVRHSRGWGEASTPACRSKCSSPEPSDRRVISGAIQWRHRRGNGRFDPQGGRSECIGRRESTANDRSSDALNAGKVEGKVKPNSLTLLVLDLPGWHKSAPSVV